MQVYTALSAGAIFILSYTMRKRILKAHIALSIPSIYVNQLYNIYLFSY
jgi:hypothetical protein